MVKKIFITVVRLFVMVMAVAVALNIYWIGSVILIEIIFPAVGPWIKGDVPLWRAIVPGMAPIVFAFCLSLVNFSLIFYSVRWALRMNIRVPQKNHGGGK